LRLVGRSTEVRLCSKADVGLAAVIDHHGPKSEVGMHPVCCARSTSLQTAAPGAAMELARLLDERVPSSAIGSLALKNESLSWKLNRQEASEVNHARDDAEQWWKSLL
jgi:hypothetical protein